MLFTPEANRSDSGFVAVEELAVRFDASLTGTGSRFAAVESLPCAFALAENRWSSYRANCLGVESSLRTPRLEYLALGNAISSLGNYRPLFKAHVEKHLGEEIREVTDRGLALGDSRFVDEMDMLTGRRLRPDRIGRPPSEGRSGSTPESRSDPTFTSAPCPSVQPIG